MAHLVRRRNRRSDVVGAVPGGAGSTPVTAEAATRRSPASARSTVTGVAASAWTPPRSGSFPRTNLGPAGRGPAPGPDRRWQHDHPTPRRHRAARRRLPRREWRATWLLASNRATWCYPWFTLSGHTALWHTSTDADRLDVEAADRAKAEQIARDHLGHGRWTATVRSTQNAITEAVLAGIRAGRDAERGA